MLSVTYSGDYGRVIVSKSAEDLLTNLAVNPRGTAFDTAGGARWQDDRWSAEVSYSAITGQTPPDGTDLTTAVRYTVGTPRNSHGFHICGNPELTDPASVISEMMDATEGVTYTVSCWLRYTGSNTQTFRIRMRFCDGVSSWTSAVIDGTTTPLPTGQWVRVSATATAPAGTTKMALAATNNTAAGVDAVADTMDGTGLMVTETDELTDYFDGSSDGWHWLGAVNLSTSSNTLPYFTIEPDGFGRLQRTRNDVYWKDVRGAREIVFDASSVFSVNDFEFWENEPNTYRLLMPAFLDDFGRTVSSGWGPAWSGQEYSVLGTASEYSVANREGVMKWTSTSTGQREVTIGAGGPADLLFAANFSFSAAPTGDFYAVDYFARYNSGNDDYILAGISFHEDGRVFIGISNYAGGVETSFTNRDISDMTILNGDDEFRMELWLEGPVARLRVYPAGSDPSDWLLATDELTVTGSGDAGINAFRETSNTNDNLELHVSEFLDELTYSLYEMSDPVTPTVSRCWLKSIDRPFLNREFDIADVSEIRFTGRGRIDFVEGRTFGVYQREVMSGEQFTLSVYTHDRGERQWLNHIAQSGDILFLQPHNPDGTAAVPEHDIPRGHYAITGATESRTARRTSRRIHELALVRVAEPGPDVYGQMSSWQTIIDMWEGWATLLAESEQTWFDLLDLVGDPREVIVA